MRLKNILFAVKDVEKSKGFYHALFGLDVVLNQEEKVILTEGLVLQDASLWKACIGRDIRTENNACALYFEERDMEGFVKKLEKLYPDTAYINRLTEHSDGRKMLRFYDPDGNLIEVGTPLIF